LIYLIDVCSLGQHRFTDLKPDLASLASTPSSYVGASVGPQQHKNIVHAMATCHSLSVVDGELMGDPLDVKMFQFTGWSYQENGSESIGPHGPKYETIMPPIARPPNQITDLSGQIGASQIVSVLPPWENPIRARSTSLIQTTTRFFRYQ
jgi:cation-transporting ATPase 13A3/4/5